MEVHVHLKNSFPGGIGNRRIRLATIFAPHPSVSLSHILESEVFIEN